jgi:hypothetical protein
MHTIPFMMHKQLMFCSPLTLDLVENRYGREATSHAFSGSERNQSPVVMGLIEASIYDLSNRFTSPPEASSAVQAKLP